MTQTGFPTRPGKRQEKECGGKDFTDRTLLNNSEGYKHSKHIAIIWDIKAGSDFQAKFAHSLLISFIQVLKMFENEHRGNKIDFKFKDLEKK